MDIQAPGGGLADTGSATVPSEAPALVWMAVLSAVALWWLWPWLARLRGDHHAAAGQSALFGTPTSEAGGLRLPHVPLAAADALLGEGAAAAEPRAEAGAGRLEVALSFDLITEFNETFTGTTTMMAKVLAGPPSGQAYTAAVTALKKLAEIIDRIFMALGSTAELAKVTCLRESSDTFRRDYGEHSLGVAMRGLLQAAGFERRQAEEGEDSFLWAFAHEDALSRLRGLTVRLCLQKSAELQKLRGPGRYLHTNNDAVLPKLEDAAFAELVDLYRGRGTASSAPEQFRPSLRERNLEADARMKLNQRRTEKGLEALSLHEGLAGIARSLADAQRTRVRKDADDLYPTTKIAQEVQSALARVPLPPGFSAAHLHWSSTELPTLFGMTSTRGGGGSKDVEDGDRAADIMSNEAVGLWAARQQSDVFWPAAALCGVGAALDYTVNKGFVVTLLIGFEQHGEGGERAGSELRRRVVAKAAEATRVSSSDPVKFTPNGSLKPRITGYKDLYNP